MKLLPQAQLIATTSLSPEAVHDRMLGQMNLAIGKGEFQPSANSLLGRWSGEIGSSRFNLQRAVGSKRQLSITGRIEPIATGTEVVVKVKPGAVSLMYLVTIAFAVAAMAWVQITVVGVGNLSVESGAVWMVCCGFLVFLWFAMRRSCREEIAFILNLLNAEPLSILTAARRE